MMMVLIRINELVKLTLQYDYVSCSQKDDYVRIFEGIHNRENSCWLISDIQMINVINIYQFVYGKFDFIIW